jgi:hypothetical protein
LLTYSFDDDHFGRRDLRENALCECGKDAYSFITSTNQLFVQKLANRGSWTVGCSYNRCGIYQRRIFWAFLLADCYSLTVLSFLPNNGVMRVLASGAGCFSFHSYERTVHEEESDCRDNDCKTIAGYPSIGRVLL